MIDQSHNLKGKIEAMIQTVAMAQELYAKAALVDYERLIAAQQATDLVRAESLPAGCVRDRRPPGDGRVASRSTACRSIPWKRFVSPVTSTALRKSARCARPQRTLRHTPDPTSYKCLHQKDLSTTFET